MISKQKLSQLIEGKTSEVFIARPNHANLLSRRKLLKGGVSMVTGMALRDLLPQKAYGQSSAGDFTVRKKLVWINLQGGWDILESVDPKPRSTPGIEIAFPWQQAHKLGNTDIKLGRWLSNIASLGNDVLPIRGLLTQTTSHTSGNVYMETGILSNSGRVNAANIPAIVASESKRDVIIPIVQLSGGAAPLLDRGIPTISTVRAQNLDLYRSMYPNNNTEKQIRLSLLNYLQESIKDSQAIFGSNNDRLLSIEASTEKIITQIEEDVSEQMKITDADRAPFSRALAQENLIGDDGVDAFALTAKLIKQNIVNVVTLGFGGFDTHANQTNRLKGIMQRVDSLVATLAQELKAANSLDSTLIVMYSDFGRTPKVNGANGRDHWPIGGSLLIGGGLDGGRVVGATDDDLQAIAVNYSTGELLENVDDDLENTTQGFLNPSHIGGSVIELCLGSSYLGLRNYLQSPSIITRLRES